jgi:hypothetical protein
MTIIVGDEGDTLRDVWEDREMQFFLVFDEAGREVDIDTQSTDVAEVKAQLVKFLNEGGRDGRRTRNRRPKNGAYVTCKWLADKVGAHPVTIRNEFLKETSGVKKRTFSGRNRKTYTVLRISKAAAMRHYPDLEI